MSNLEAPPNAAWYFESPSLNPGDLLGDLSMVLNSVRFSPWDLYYLLHIEGGLKCCKKHCLSKATAAQRDTTKQQEVQNPSDSHQMFTQRVAEAEAMAADETLQGCCKVPQTGI